MGEGPAGSALRARLLRFGPWTDRPREARQARGRSETAGAETATHEQCRRARLPREPEPCRAEPFAVPPRRQADDEQAGVAARLEHALLARRSQPRLGRNAQAPLNGEGAGREQPTRVALAVLRNGGGACEP